MTSRKHERKWWKEAVVYQIYPSSFCDSNGDGIGDIPGILTKLDYLANIGITCLWLSPHYMSPQQDIGYDISDYEDIYPPYGTLQQTQSLIDACHARGMKIIFDLVINHTSSEHKWFKESRSSKDNPKRDWYFWKPPRGWENGKPLPPNNWRSNFGGSAWAFDEGTQEFFLHLYANEMPDLNWENPITRQAIYETSIHFWLKRGIDGFRIDVVNKYSKDISFKDAPIVDTDIYDQSCTAQTANGPRVHEFISEMYDVLSQYKTSDGGEIMTVGELPGSPALDLVDSYVNPKMKQLNMVFNFDTVDLGRTHPDVSLFTPFKIADFRDRLSKWQNHVSTSSAWTTVFLENHDQGRSISRFADDCTELSRVRSGKLLAMILTTMTGTLYIYQGQEIGMTNIPLSWDISEYKDIRTTNIYRLLIERGATQDRLESARRNFQKLARDHARTPMQWDNTPNGGFCDSNTSPWMRVNDNYTHVNVQTAEYDPKSLLNFWKKLIKMRNEYKDIFVYGRFTLLDSHDDVFTFMKEAEDDNNNNNKRMVTVANMSGVAVPWDEGHDISSEFKLLLSNVEEDESEDGGKSELRPWEARIYEAV